MRHPSLTRPTRSGERAEYGFTLIEVLAALMVLSFVLLALAATLVSGYRSLRDAKDYQQATALGNQAIETARNLSYDALVMVTGELTGDARVSACGIDLCYDPGPGPAEPIVHTAAGGGLSPRVTNPQVDNREFTVTRYLTWVDATNDAQVTRDYKRLSVYVEWDNAEGNLRSYQTSTFITRARRGLPVPKFVLLPEATSITGSPGSDVVFAHEIQNSGIPDTYDLEIALPVGWTARFYRDSGAPDEGVLGEYDPAFDEEITAGDDTNGTGIRDTGQVPTDESFYFLVVIRPASSSGTFDSTLTATSGADATASDDATDTVVVEPVRRVLFLHQPPPNTSNTNATLDLRMTTDPPAGTNELLRYSQDVQSRPQRWLAELTNAQDPPSSATSLTASQMGIWNYLVPSRITVGGQSTLTLYLAPIPATRDGSCNRNVVLDIFVRRRAGLLAADSTGTSVAATGHTLTATSCLFVEREILITLPTITLEANEVLYLKVFVRRATDGAFAGIGYDVPAYPSALSVPVISQ